MENVGCSKDEDAGRDAVGEGWFRRDQNNCRLVAKQKA